MTQRHARHEHWLVMYFLKKNILDNF